MWIVDGDKSVDVAVWIVKHRQISLDLEQSLGIAVRIGLRVAHCMFLDLAVLSGHTEQR